MKENKTNREPESPEEIAGALKKPKIKFSLKNYQDLLDAAPDAMLIVNRSGEIIQANPQATELFGYHRNELIGSGIEKLLPARNRKPHKQFRSDFFTEPRVRPMGAGKNLVCRQKDGAELPVEISLSPLMTDSDLLVIASIRDVTGRRRVESFLRESEKKYHSIFDQARDGIVLIDAKTGQIADCNHAFEELTGRGLKQLNRTKIWELRPAEKQEAARKIFFRVLKSGIGGSAELEMQKPDGSLVPVEFTSRRVNIGRQDFIQSQVRDISERRRMDEELRNGEARTRMLFEYAANPIWLEDFSEVKKEIDRLKKRGVKNFDAYLRRKPELLKKLAAMVRVTEVNQKSVEFYGVKSKAEMLTVLPEWFVEDSWTVFRDEVVALASGKTRFEGEIPVRTPRGEIKHLIVKLWVPPKFEQTLESVMVSFVDITDRKRQEKQQLERLRELQVLNDFSQKVTATLSMPEVIRAALDGVQRAINPDLVMLFQKDKMQLKLIGEGPAETRFHHHVTPNHTVGQCLCGIAALKKEPVYSLNIEMDHRCTWDECKRAGLRSFAALPLLSRNGVIGVLGLASGEERDFGKRAKFLETLANQISTAFQNAVLHNEVTGHANVLEQRVAERTAELAAAMEKARSADRLKSAFLATMSHELRTPLNSIIGFTGILLQSLSGPLNPEQTKQLGMVQNSAHHLLNLINDVLDISKIEAGQLEIYEEPFSPADSVKKVLKTVEPLAEEKGLQVISNLSPDVGEVLGDRRRVEQVLLNLLNNAIKFTEKGRVVVQMLVSEENVEFHVQDTGIGIKRENLLKLFQPFQQVESGLSRPHEGTGLGLSISKKLVEMMGGRIWVKSRWGQGSTFSFTLPRIRGEADGTRNSGD